MKHSAGPWSASAASSVVGSLIDNGQANIAAVMPQTDKRETEANARLIAAAPKLLAACQEMMIRLTDMFDRHERPTYASGSNPDSDLALLLATGKEAIAEATGLRNTEEG